MKSYPMLALIGAAAAAALGVSAASAQPAAPPAAPAAAPAPAPAAQNSIVGTALYVTDVARSIRFYRDILGMTVRLQFGPKDKPDVLMGFGADPTKPNLMLLSDRSATPAAKIDHGHGFDRFVVMMADTPAVAARLRAAGFAAADPREVHGTSMMLMVTDPDGYKVEIIDTKPVRR